MEPHALFLLSLAEVCLSGVAVWNNFSSLQKFRQLHFPEQSASDLQCRSSIAYWRWKETKKWQHISSRSVLALCLWLILILMAFTQVTHAKDQLQLRCSSWCQGLSNHESISASIDSFLRKPKPLQWKFIITVNFSKYSIFFPKYQKKKTKTWLCLSQVALKYLRRGFV